MNSSRSSRLTITSRCEAPKQRSRALTSASRPLNECTATAIAPPARITAMIAARPRNTEARSSARPIAGRPRRTSSISRVGVGCADSHWR